MRRSNSTLSCSRSRFDVDTRDVARCVIRRLIEGFNHVKKVKSIPRRSLWLSLRLRWRYRCEFGCRWLRKRLVTLVRIPLDLEWLVVLAAPHTCIRELSSTDGVGRHKDVLTVCYDSCDDQVVHMIHVGSNLIVSETLRAAADHQIAAVACDT